MNRLCHMGFLEFGVTGIQSISEDIGLRQKLAEIASSFCLERGV